MSIRWASSLAALLLALSASPAALADAVMPPPDGCPSGAAGETSHNGPWCSPTTCAADLDCPKSTSAWEKYVCREQPLCVEMRSETSQSGWSWGKPITRAIAHSECDADGLCAAPSTCDVAKRCVKTRTLLPTGRCAVATPGAPSSAGLAWLGALLAVAAIAARRRRGGS